MAEVVLSSVAEAIIGKLVDLIGQEIGQFCSVKGDLEKFKGTVSAIKAVLRDAEERQAESHAVRDWLGKLKDIVDEADDLVDDFSTEALRREVMTRNKKAKKVRIFFSKSNQLAYRLKLSHNIKAISEKLDVILADGIRFNFVVERSVRTQVLNMAREQTHSFVLEEEVIGREDDKEAVIELLLDPNVEENVSILPIVGIGGLGKTTLAQLVFNDDKIQTYFEKKMWVCVSNNFDVKVVVEKILESVTNLKPEKSLEMDTLVKELKKEIDGKKYFLVLDDVWNENTAEWVRLKNILMGGARGARIVVTTRSEKVAAITKSKPFPLKSLDKEKSWSLFKHQAFDKGEEPNSNLVEIGKEIVEKCVGVPLAIRTIGSLLYFKDLETEWLSLKNNELLKISQSENAILSTLKLSYDHLPLHLKQCFAYCSLFPKDYEIDISNLINLWIAQGFISLSDHNTCLEDVGHDYFMDLVWRSFFQEVKEDTLGNLTTCKIHDLMHDVATSVAEKVSTTLYLKGENIDEKIRHVSFGFKLSSTQIPTPLFKASRIRTFLLPCQPWFQNESFNKSTFEKIVSSFRFLRLLDMHNTGIHMVPSSISELKHLRYLDLSENRHIEMLPNSITKLQNLETLRLTNCSNLKALPKDIKKLVNLRRLEIDFCRSFTHMPRGLGQLTNLQILSQFVTTAKDFSHNGELKELYGLNNLRGELQIQNLGHVKSVILESKDANLKEKKHLQGLDLYWRNEDVNDADVIYDEMSLEGFEPHPNLKLLYLECFSGVRFPSWLQSLSNLVHFSLSNCNKCQHLPPLDQLHFLKKFYLRKLDTLEDISLSEENGSSEELSVSSFFLSLKRLTLENCPNLKGWRRKMDSIEESHLLLPPSFPPLSSLLISNCPKLTSMPMFPYLKEQLNLNNSSIKPLQQTLTMEMKNMKSPTSTTTITSSSSSFSSSTIVASLSAPLSNLKSLTIRRIEELECLLEDWLRNLTSLEELKIFSCPRLKSLSQGNRNLTALKKLIISHCKELDLSSDGDGMHWQSLTSLHTLEFDQLPKLASFPVGLQHVTTLQELKIWRCDSLMAIPEWINNLTSLRTLEFDQLPKLASLPVGLQHVTTLQELKIWRCDSLMAIPEWISNLTSLRQLQIEECPNLTSLPQGMRALTSLHTLVITNCPILSQRCKRNEGEDWPKISHIPNLEGDLFRH